jgi:hypothetical protein
MLVPITVFTGAKMTGVVSSPVNISETTRLQTVMWNRERPYEWSDIPGDKLLSTNYSDGEMTFVTTFCLVEYDPNFWGRGAGLSGFGISSLNASVSKGFVQGVEMTYKESYSASIASFHYTALYVNLETSEVYDGYSNSQMLGNDSKASWKAFAIGQPSEVYMGDRIVDYYLHSPFNYTHYITIEAAVTYFNGTAYKQIIQPVEVVFGPDHNNSFRQAEETGFGTHEDYVDKYSDGDPVDYFKVFLFEGQKVNISTWNAPHPGELVPDIFVYDPEENLEASQISSGTSARSDIILSTSQTGWWYIRVTTTTAVYFLYTLDISLIPRRE